MRTWTRYPTAVGPKPVRSAEAPSFATMRRPPERRDWPFMAGSICMRVFTTSIAVLAVSISIMTWRKATYASCRHG